MMAEGMMSEDAGQGLVGFVGWWGWLQSVLDDPFIFHVAVESPFLLCVILVFNLISPVKTISDIHSVTQKSPSYSSHMDSGQPCLPPPECALLMRRQAACG